MRRQRKDDMTVPRKLFTVLFAAIALAIASPAKAGLLYSISLDTMSLTGITGYVEFQFNPGPPSTDPATAIISDFSSDGTLTTPAGDIGDVTGAFPNPVQINNTDAVNDHAEGFTFGSFFDVFVELEIPNISGTATSGSSFFLTLDDSSFNPLIAPGPVVEIDLDPLGNPSVINNSPNSEATVVLLPEPRGAMMLTGLLMALAAVRLMRRYADGLEASRRRSGL